MCVSTLNTVGPSSHCAQNFEFFMITESLNKSEVFQGLLGLMPDPNNVRCSYGAYLKASNTIGKHIVSISATKGKLSFGGYE